MEENEVKEEVIPKELSSKVGQLQSAIAELAQYLETQSMDCYFNSLLAQLDKLSQDVNTRLEEVSTFYAFLVGSSPAATSRTIFLNIPLHRYRIRIKFPARQQPAATSRFCQTSYF